MNFRWLYRAGLLIFVCVVSLAAVQGPEPRVALGSLRAYWHVFIAYAVGWVLILGWILSIGRRLAKVETRLSAPSQQ